MERTKKPKKLVLKINRSKTNSAKSDKSTISSTKIRKIKTKINYTNPNKILQYILQGQINPNFISVPLGKKISKKSSEVALVRTEGINKLLDIFKPLGITSIITNHLESVEKNQLGIIAISNIGNNGNLYFKSFSPNSLLLYNILGCLNPLFFMDNKIADPIYTTELDKFSVFLDENNPLLEKYSITKLKVIEISTKLIIGNVQVKLQEIETVCKIISVFIGNTSILLFQDSIRDPREIINCTDEQDNIQNNQIISLYMSYPPLGEKKFNIKPVININKNILYQINYTISNIEENLNQRKHFYSLITKIKSQSTKPIIISKKRKINEFITFNPYDKNIKLPIIEIQTKIGKKNFLLGNELDGYYNIYEDDETNNKLAGKVEFNKSRSLSNTSLNVFWCNGFPK